MNEDVDIDKVIEEGVKNFEKLQKLASQEIEEGKLEEVNTFDFNLQKTDKFIFQEKDFREEKKKYQVEKQQKNAASLRAKSLVKAKTKVQEFQFLANPKRIKELADVIQMLQKTMNKIGPNDVIDGLKEEYNQLMQDGFTDWSPRDYAQFIHGFEQVSDYEDAESISKYIDSYSKSTEEVQKYLDVFLVRFRETNEKEMVLRKFHQKQIDKENRKVLLGFAEYQDYSILLQENSEFGRKEYIQMMEKQAKKMKEMPEQQDDIKLLLKGEISHDTFKRLAQIKKILDLNC